MAVGIGGTPSLMSSIRGWFTFALQTTNMLHYIGLQNCKIEMQIWNQLTNAHQTFWILNGMVPSEIWWRSLSSPVGQATSSAPFGLNLALRMFLFLRCLHNLRSCGQRIIRENTARNRKTASSRRSATAPQTPTFPPSSQTETPWARIESQNLLQK